MTTIAPPSADLRPGLSREFAVGASADRKQYEVRFVPGASGVQNRQPRWAFNCNLVYLRRTDAGEDANAVASQFFLDEAAKRWVDGRQHRVRSAKKRDFEPALGESIGHLKPDVACADQDRRARASLRHESMDRETVIHRVQQKHTLQFASRKVGSHRLGAGRDDQAIIAHRHLRSRAHK